jgi:hypothetical protein
MYYFLEPGELNFQRHNWRICASLWPTGAVPTRAARVTLVLCFTRWRASLHPPASGTATLKPFTSLHFSGKLSPARHSQLGEHAVQVALNSGDGDEQPVRYLGVCQVLANEGDDPAL